MLHALSARRQELRGEKRKIDNSFVGLMSNLQASLLSDEDLTVVPSDTFTDAATESFRPELAEDKRGNDVGLSPSASVDSGLRKPQPTVAALPAPSSPLAEVASFASSMLEHLSTSVGQAVDSPARFQRTLPTRVDDSHPSPRTMSAGARAWRERNGRSASRHVDFRTGMSGHMGLGVTSYMVHPHDYLEHKPRTTFRMSSHSGLTMTRPRAREQRSNSLSNPSEDYNEPMGNNRSY